jgi:hypothetical protein
MILDFSKSKQVNTLSENEKSNIFKELNFNKWLGKSNFKWLL